MCVLYTYILLLLLYLSQISEQKTLPGHAMDIPRKTQQLFCTIFCLDISRYKELKEIHSIFEQLKVLVYPVFSN